MRRISIGALPVFEAVARHLSFKDAAVELHLSPSAVSHAMSKLEGDVGTLLFDRSRNGLALTHDGLMFQRPISEAVGLINGAVDALFDRQALVLRLHASPSFAALWLSPRLNIFLAENPDFEVTISADPDVVQFVHDEFDVDIVYGLPEQEGLVIHSLGAVEVQPMCSPAMAERLQRIEDLQQVPLIRSMIKTVNWADWFRANGGAMPPQAIRFDRSFMAIAAAADGMGVCLESVRLAERDLASGRLVLPFAGRSVALVEANHFLVYPQRNAQRPVIQAFRDWLMGTLQEPPMSARK